MQPKEYFIEHLNMHPHVEGGYYVETYQSEVETDGRPIASSIHFLLTDQNFSAFHRLDAQELWYYHYGAALHVEMIHQDGTHQTVKIGPNLDEGEVLQYCVPKGAIFGSHVTHGFSVVGCMVAPAFQYQGFELCQREALLERYPEHKDIIMRLTRP